MAVAWGVVSQLHFLVFVTLPILIVLFLFWNGNFKKRAGKVWGLVLLILLVIFFPMILSDLKTGGDNVKQFIFALENKPQADYSWPQKFFQNFINHGNYYTLYPTSYISRTGKTSMLAGLVLIVATLLKMFWSCKEERNKDQRAFISDYLHLVFGIFLASYSHLPFKSALVSFSRFSFCPLCFLPSGLSGF